MAEAVFDGQVQLRRAEQAVEDVFQPGAVQVVQFVSRDHLHISQQVGGVFVCACDAGFHSAAGYADLVDQLAVLGYEGVVGLAAQHIDSAAFYVVRLGDVAEQWAGIYLDKPRSGTPFTVLIKRTLEGSLQQIAVRLIRVDDAQTPICLCIRRLVRTLA